MREELFKILLKKEKITPERVELLRSWRHSGFNVSSDRRIAQGERLELEKLLQYMVRAPVSLARLSYDRHGMVTYRGNYHPSLGRDHQLVSGLEFLAMLVPHVALRYESRIHSYGAISTTIRRELGWIEKDEESAQAPRDVVVLDEEESDFVTLRRKSWRRLIARAWLQDPQLCPGCAEPMRVVSAINSPHQDDVIEKILKHSGHNTSRPLVTIHYPFHPLAGTRFRPVRACPGPPPVYVLQLPDRRLAVPVWMTEDWTSTLQLSELPVIGAEELLELASFVETTLVALRSPSCILTANSVSKEDHDDGPMDSTSLRNRTKQGRAHSTPSGSRAGRRRHGTSASSNPQPRGRKGGRR